jgi:hypothetical protein
VQTVTRARAYDSRNGGKSWLVNVSPPDPNT